MRKKVLCAVLIGALVLLCAAAQAQTEPGMGVFAETKKSGIKWVDQLMRRLDMPYTLISSREYTPEKAMEWYEKAFAAGREEGFVPVLVAPTEEMSHHVLRSGSLWENRQEALAEAEEIYQERYGSEKQREELTCSEELLHMIGYLASLYCASEEECTFALVLVPAENIWELPAWLPTGGMREDIPDLTTQIVTFRHWYNQHGMLPVYMDDESWEICLTQAPKTRLRRLQFSLELCTFCPMYGDSLFSCLMEDFYGSSETDYYACWWPEDFYGSFGGTPSSTSGGEHAF